MIGIIGNSITAYTIAATLEYLGINEYEIIKQGEDHKPPMLLLKYKDITQLHTYSKIYGKSICSYSKKIKIGYLTEYGIVDKISKKEIEDYLLKQGRVITKSAMSDNLSSFKALDLSKIYDKLKEKYKNKVIETFDKNKYSLIFDTIDISNYVCSINSGKEYLVKAKSDLKDYDYIYDCRLKSSIKRYTKDYIEFLKKPNEEYVEITNYYDDFEVFTKKNFIIIGRSATKTQTKQEDIIHYILENRYEIRSKK